MYKKLTDGHWISDHIEDKELFPVGGSFAGALDLYVSVDAKRFQPLFKKMADYQALFEKNEVLKKWFLAQPKSDFDYSLFCHMFSFNKVMEKAFPHITRNCSKRADFYDSEGKHCLSEAYNEGYCACGEFSVLAQLYFQSQNIPTRYVGGELVENEDFSDFEAHSFIVFQDKEKDYVFDSVNPISTRTGSVPRIAEFVGKKDNFYLQTKNIFTSIPDKWYYAGGEKGAFLKNLSEKSSLIETLDRKSKKVVNTLQKDKIND
ncbi:MAG: transglutaminase domain-containing protein [Alphaproteobacteria bacterium]